MLIQTIALLSSMLWLQSISILQPDRHLPLTLSLPSSFPFSILINNVFGSMEILKPFRGEILNIGHLDCKNDIIECRNNWCCQPHMWMCQYWTPMFVYICHVLSKYLIDPGIIYIVMRRQLLQTKPSTRIRARRKCMKEQMI